MPICADCKKEVLRDFHSIKSKRNTEIHICYECMKKYRRKEGNSAGHSS